MQLSIIIVNYNVKYFLEQCLCSVLRACAGLQAEIIVEDNNSTDGSRAYLEPKFPQVMFYWNKENAGFGKANNAGIKKATGDHILLLNPDTIVDEDSFYKCLEFFKMHHDCGALGVRMIDGSGEFLKESKRSFPSPEASFYKLAGLAKLFPQSEKFAAYYAGHLPEHETNEVDVLAGAFIMLSRAAINATQGFDEDFFMYGEDVDLSYRLQQQGFKNYYFPGTTIVHFKGESSSRQSRSHNKNFYGAMRLFVGKHLKQQKARYYFMEMAISATHALADLRSMLPIGKQKKAMPIPVAVVGTNEAFNKIIHLLKNASPQVLIEGHINNETISSDALVEQLLSFEKAHEGVYIILTTEPLTYLQMIHITNKSGGQLKLAYHGAGTGSIVSSADKNSNGLIIARE